MARTRQHRSNQPAVDAHEVAGFDPRVDQDLYEDILTLREIYAPVVANDGAVYDASSLLQILRAGGMSLVNPALRLTQAFFVPAIQNTIDNYLGEDHPDRIEAYDREQVLAEIKAELSQNNNAPAPPPSSQFYDYLDWCNKGSLLTALMSGGSWLFMRSELSEFITFILVLTLEKNVAPHASSIIKLSALLKEGLFTVMAASSTAFITTSVVSTLGRTFGFFAANNREQENAAVVPAPDMALHLVH